MKRKIVYILIILLTFLTSSSYVIDTENVVEIIIDTAEPTIEPIYDNIWGTIYHPVKSQCDENPTITGDGSRINPYEASEHRWIAISQEMLNCDYRTSLLNDSTSVLYKGKIEYGDTVWISSENKNINGWWIVHDTKNKRYRNSIDFLQTKGDASLYNNDESWGGKFNNIKIYTIQDAKKLGIINPLT